MHEGSKYANNQDSAGLWANKIVRVMKANKIGRLIIRTLHKLRHTEGKFTARHLMNKANLLNCSTLH